MFTPIDDFGQKFGAKSIYAGVVNLLFIPFSV